MRSIRGGMGIGDAIYLAAVVRHLVARGEQLEVCTAWPEVFQAYADRIKLSPFRRSPVDVLAHYSRRRNWRTRQFEDVCIQAGIAGPVELRLDWTVTDQDLTRRLLAYRRPIVCVQLPRAPMGRTDGIGHELLPDCRRIQEVLDRLRGRVLLVQIGAGRPLYKFSGIDVDLRDETTISQLFDVASLASGFVGYVSYLVPMAEAFEKPALLVWSRMGLRSTTGFVRQITPQKILERASSLHVVDNCPTDQLSELTERFFDALRLPG